MLILAIICIITFLGIWCQEDLECNQLYSTSIKQNANGKYSEYARTLKQIIDKDCPDKRRAMSQLGILYLYDKYGLQDHQSSRQFLMMAANLGDSEAQRYIALFYQYGLMGFDKNVRKYLLYYYFSALSGNPESAMVLGYHYFLGLNVKAQCNISAHYYEISSNHSISNIISGYILNSNVRSLYTYNSGNYMNYLQNRVSYYEERANNGDSYSAFLLGHYYFFGLQGVSKDYEKSFHYHFLAADKGYERSNCYIGYMLLLGKGTEARPEYAFDLLEISKDLDYFCLYGIGLAYIYGIGVEQDVLHGFVHLRQAFKKHDIHSSYFLGLHYLNGMYFERDFTEAFKILRKLAGMGHFPSMEITARMSMYGIGTLKHCQYARDNFKEISENGNLAEAAIDGQNSYDDGYRSSSLWYYLRCSSEGFSICQNNAISLILRGVRADKTSETNYLNITSALLMLASSSGSAYANVQLGNSYYEGTNGFEQSFESAFERYQIVTNSPTLEGLEALYNVGYMYQMGYGVQQNFNYASETYFRAYNLSAQLDIPQAPVVLRMVGLWIQRLYVSYVLKEDFNTYQFIATLINDYRNTDELLLNSGTLNFYYHYAIPSTFKTIFILMKKSVESLYIFLTGLPYIIKVLPRYIYNYWKNYDIYLNNQYENTLLTYAIGGLIFCLLLRMYVRMRMAGPHLHEE